MGPSSNGGFVQLVVANVGRQGHCVGSCVCVAAGVLVSEVFVVCCWVTASVIEPLECWVICVVAVMQTAHVFGWQYLPGLTVQFGRSSQLGRVVPCFTVCGAVLSSHRGIWCCKHDVPGVSSFGYFSEASYLVDPASSHMLVSKTKPCMCKYKRLNRETANGSLNQL